MRDRLSPFTTLLDMANGRIDPERETTERTLLDLRGYFHTDPDGVDEIVYRIYGIPVPQTNSNLLCSTTVLEPGDVGGEFYMTKGHFHVERDRAEIYIGIAGKGRLVLATEEGRYAVEPIRRGTVNYIPGGWAHRSVNVGDEPLVFFAAYVGDAGHDYETIEREGFPVLLLKRADGSLQVVENPTYKR